MSLVRRLGGRVAGRSHTRRSNGASNDGSTTPIPSGLVSVLFVTHPHYLDHVAGPRHPERPARLEAVLEGLRRADLTDAVIPIEPRRATPDELELIHPATYVAAVEAFCAGGGGRIDADTGAGPESYDVAVLAAGAGLAAVERARRRHGDGGVLRRAPARPPRHWRVDPWASASSTTSRSPPRCLPTAASGCSSSTSTPTTATGRRTCSTPTRGSLYVSMHEWPLYPGTGDLDEIGSGDGLGTTVNFPLPAGATGDAYLAAIDEVVAPLAETWRSDVAAAVGRLRRPPPRSADRPRAVERRLRRHDRSPARSLVPPGRLVAFLEGGYDLEALGGLGGGLPGCPCWTAISP